MSCATHRAFNEPRGLPVVLGSSRRHWPTTESRSICDGGKVAFASSGSSYVSTNGSSGPTIGQFLPRHEDAWFEAINAAVEAIRLVNSTAGDDG